MILYPNAKLNFGLNVVAERPDGFHDIETLFYPYFGLCDILEVVEASETSIHLYGIGLDGNPQDNLCMRAYNLVRGDLDIPPVEIHLYKKIPAGAGLGGGSSDASHTLMALDTMFNLNLGEERLAGYAAQLGSDCPFFIYNTPMMAGGRGDVLSDYPLSISGYEIELVTPEIFVSTKEAYSGVTPHHPDNNLKDVLKRPVDEWKRLLKNDFEKSVFALHPELEEVKNSFYRRGAVYAAMSGSGSSMFGLFRNKQ